MAEVSSNGGHTNNYPKLHNSTWPGVVGKGAPGAEPIIPLDTLLELTAKAEVDGVKYDGVDLWLADPHISIDRVRARAKAWGSTLEVVSRGGHLNTESGHGPWPRARVLVRDLVARSRRPQLRRAG